MSEELTKEQQEAMDKAFERSMPEGLRKVQNEYSNAEQMINTLNKLYELNEIQYNKLQELELIYEKYKYQNILNSHKNFELKQKLGDLSNFFEEIKNNKDKYAYLLHNSGITDSYVIKVKHGKKMELIKVEKSCY